MATILKTKSLYFSDVNLISHGNGKVNSRTEVPKELNRVFVSPMSAIIGETFVKTAAPLGIRVCLQRFCEPQEQARLFNLFLDSGGNIVDVFVCIGINNGINEIEQLIQKCKELPPNLLIDCAFADIPKLKNYIDELNKKFTYKRLMIGNCHSAQGLQSLLHKIWRNRQTEYYIRINVGGGGPCSTSDFCGINRGQITELIECSDFLEQQDINNVFLLSDGGCYKPANLVKAIGAGAFGSILGSYFVKSNEAETHVIGDGTYWGGASGKQQILHTGKQYRHSEGKVVSITETKPLKELVDDLWGGLSSAISYLGYKTVTEFQGNGVFEIKANSLPPKNRV